MYFSANLHDSFASKVMLRGSKNELYNYVTLCLPLGIVYSLLSGQMC